MFRNRLASCEIRHRVTEKKKPWKNDACHEQGQSPRSRCVSVSLWLTLRDDYTRRTKLQSSRLRSIKSDVLACSQSIKKRVAESNYQREIEVATKLARVAGGILLT